MGHVRSSADATKNGDFRAEIGRQKPALRPVIPRSTRCCGNSSQGLISTLAPVKTQLRSNSIGSATEGVSHEGHAAVVASERRRCSLDCRGLVLCGLAALDLTPDPQLGAGRQSAGPSLANPSSGGASFTTGRRSQPVAPLKRSCSPGIQQRCAGVHGVPHHPEEDLETPVISLGQILHF